MGEMGVRIKSVCYIATDVDQQSEITVNKIYNTHLLIGWLGSAKLIIKY